jgi:hypothetical protein
VDDEDREDTLLQEPRPEPETHLPPSAYDKTVVF